VGAAVKYVSRLVETEAISSLKGEVESSRVKILNKYVRLLTFSKELALGTSDLPQSKIQ
jgi:hypothetical protein